MSNTYQLSESSLTTYISQLSKIITQDFLNITEQPISSHGLEILSKLERYYKEEGCDPNNNDSPEGLKSEKQFILRSLPYISSVIQLRSTIQSFNDAMKQIEKIYDLEDKPFDQAIILSYIVFSAGINRGCQHFLGDLSSSNYDNVKLAEGAKKRENPPPTKEALWKEMNSQLQSILKGQLKPSSNGEKGSPWYTLSRRHARKISDMFGEINNQYLNEEEIKNHAKAMLENLKIAIQWDSQCQEKAVKDKAFDTFRGIISNIQIKDEEFNEIRKNIMELLGNK